MERDSNRLNSKRKNFQHDTDEDSENDDLNETQRKKNRKNQSQTVESSDSDSDNVLSKITPNKTPEQQFRNKPVPQNKHTISENTEDYEETPEIQTKNPLSTENEGEYCNC